MLRKLAIIGGSGLYSLEKTVEVVHREIIHTPYGEPSSPVLYARHGQTELVFLSRHGVGHRLPPHKINYRANLWTLKNLGVTDIVSVNAVGGIAENFNPCELALPDQLIDYTWGREHSFYGGDGAEVVHVDMTRPFSPALRQELLAVAQAHALPILDQGVYGCTQGPRLETAAEIRRLTRDGCTMVGMTAMPEAALARELGIQYASLALSVNWAAGIGEAREISMQEISSNLEQGMARVKQLLLYLFERGLR